MNHRKTQRLQIEDHLRAGRTLTSIEALELFGCFRLAAQIHSIKKHLGPDEEITSTIIEVPNRSGSETGIARYELAKKKRIAWVIE